MGVTFNFILVLIGLCLILNADCKKFSRCDLARELKKQGFPRNKLADWVCLIEAESSRQTHIVSKPNANGSRDYGLFQINDKYWCTASGPPGKDCHLRCKGLQRLDLLTDDITKASACAKKIFARHGFTAWYGWINHCKNKPLPDLSGCGI